MNGFIKKKNNESPNYFRSDIQQVYLAHKFTFHDEAKKNLGTFE